MNRMNSWRPEQWKNPYRYDGWRSDAFEAGASAIIPAIREAILKEVGEMGVRVRLASCAGKPIVEFDDGDCIDQTGALAEFLMHLSILMPNCELPDDLTIIPTKVLEVSRILPEEIPIYRMGTSKVIGTLPRGNPNPVDDTPQCMER